MNKREERVAGRLMRYAKIETTSDPHAAAYPTSDKQGELAKLLAEELTALGVPEVFYDEQAYIVYGRLPGNLPEGRTAKAVGLIAHMDTSPDAPGKDVKPRIVSQYDGTDILLNEEQGIVMRTADYPKLLCYIGQDLIVTDGTTLLGADDKAGIASIMTLLEEYIENPALPHGDICVAFTPDEEVGGLARDLDLARFGADAAYTVDCDHLGYYSAETFNAAAAKISITGRGVHPGTAKGIMINAAEIAAEFICRLPEKEKPQYTDGYDGFYYVTDCRGCCEETRIELIIRDFDAARFQQKKDYLAAVTAELNEKYGEGRIRLMLTEQYRNMGEVVGKFPYLAERLHRAIAMSGVTPVNEPFRGGTDGAALSFRGLPCPNLSSGYENAHGRFEYVPVQSMAKNVEILQNLLTLYIEE